jgi:hypothetical protein
MYHETWQEALQQVEGKIKFGTWSFDIFRPTATTQGFYCWTYPHPINPHTQRFQIQTVKTYDTNSLSTGTRIGKRRENWEK